jgi:hypothetical protein
MDRAYYDVDEHLVNDFYQVVPVQLNRFYLNEFHNQSNHKLSEIRQMNYFIDKTKMIFYTCKQ